MSVNDLRVRYVEGTAYCPLCPFSSAHRSRTRSLAVVAVHVKIAHPGVFAEWQAEHEDRL